MASPSATDIQDPSPTATGDAASQSRVRLVVVLIFASIVALLVLLHIPGINGTIYWPWHYRRIEWWRIYPALLIAIVPFAWSLRFLRATRPRPVSSILAMMLSTFAMQIIVAGMYPGGFDIGRIAQIVDDKMTTSYFTDATLLAAQPSIRPFLQQYDELLPHFTFHSREKPPGPILYYTFFLRLLGGTANPGDAALLGGIVTGLLATFSIPACYWLIRLITADVRSALIAAAYFSACPCMIVFLPMFDPVYPLLSCALVGFWILSLRENRYWASAAFGAVLALAVFFSYAILVMGTLFVGYFIVENVRTGRPAAMRFVIHSSIAIAVVVALYAVLWMTSGFNPIATFRQAFANQQELLAHLMVPRPWPNTIPFDVQDFLLGSGWISLPLLVFSLVSRRASSVGLPRTFVFLGLAQIAVVALTGLLPGETSRVWTFLQPLILLPIALELAKWAPRHAAIALLLVALLTAIFAQNMIFVRLG